MHPARSRSRLLSSRQLSAFTLVEMLTVMAIIAVLIAVTVPALRGISGSGGRKAAVRTLMGVLDQARMLSISDGRATYVVFAGQNLVGKNCDSMLGRACALYEDNANYTPVQRSAWIYLPVGASFKVGSDFDTLVNRALGKSDPTFMVSSPKGDSDEPASVKLPYVKFDATGAVDGTLANDSAPQHFRILVFQGSVNATGGEVATRAVTGGSAAQQVLLDEIRLNPATGRARYTLNPADNLPAKSS